MQKDASVKDIDAVMAAQADLVDNQIHTQTVVMRERLKND